MGNAPIKKLGFSSSSKKVPRDARRPDRSASKSIEVEETMEELLSKGPIEDYYVIDHKAVLGRGHYATVNLATCKKTGKHVAVKRIGVGKSRIEALQREVNVLRKIGSHPNIVTLYDIFYKEGELQLVLELLKGGELFDRMVEKGPYSEQEASHHIRKIGLALKFLHRHGIVHRDLKPENLILADKSDNSELKIADFGLSKMVDDIANSTMQTVCGTWAYCAPEVKTSVTSVHNYASNGQSVNKNVACYTAAVDLWSVGVIMFVILGAYHPFDPDGDASDSQLWANIVSGQFDFDDPAWDSISDSAKDLIRKLIVVDPAKRYTTDQLLSHPWVTQTASVPSTPITPQIDKSLKGFVKHKKPQLMQFPNGPAVNSSLKVNANYVNPVPVQHNYATRSQQAFTMKTAVQPPVPEFGFGNQKKANMVPVTNQFGNMNPNANIMLTNGLNLKLETRNRNSDHMDLVN